MPGAARGGFFPLSRQDRCLSPWCRRLVRRPDRFWTVPDDAAQDRRPRNGVGRVRTEVAPARRGRRMIGREMSGHRSPGLTVVGVTAVSPTRHVRVAATPAFAEKGQNGGRRHRRADGIKPTGPVRQSVRVGLRSVPVSGRASGQLSLGVAVEPSVARAFRLVGARSDGAGSRPRCRSCRSLPMVKDRTAG